MIFHVSCTDAGGIGRKLFLFVSILCVCACSGAIGNDFVPFVIPARPKTDSPIAAKAGPVIRPDSERLIARSGHFYRGDKQVRLWGVNLSFGANLPTHEDAPYIAARLAAAGVNAVRCHHLDTAQWPRGVWNASDGKTITPEALDRLDFFIDQLARRGICVNLNLHVGRAHSRYLGLPETNRQYDKISNIFTPELIEAQKQYAREMLGHENAYRKVRYADDPAVALVEITNENSFFMWGSEETLRTLPPYYADILGKKFNAWLGRSKSESNEAGSVPLFADNESPEHRLRRMRFLAETEKAYFDDMRDFIKNELGCGALVTGTIVFGPLGLYAQSDMDFIDTHAYWQHPRFPGRPWDAGNWLISQKPMTDYPAEAPLFRLAAARLLDKPFTLSEYNHPAPLDSQAECVPVIASFAAAQDWDGVWLYTYSHGTDDWYREKLNSYFDIDANPAKWGFMRAGAAIFRDRAVAPVNGFIYEGLVDQEDVVGSLAKLHLKYDRDMFALRSEAGIVTREAMLNCQFPAALTGRHGHRDIFGPNAKLEWTVENGKGMFIVNSWGASVYTGHANRFEKATKGRISVSRPEFVAITVTSLDGIPSRALDQSEKILVAACGRCENTGMVFSRDRRTVGRNWGGPPVQIETVTGTVAVPAGPWTCEALGPDGMPKRKVPIRKGVLEMSPEYGTMWYLLTRQTETKLR